MLSSLNTKNRVACYVYEANIISELAMMFENGDVCEDDLNAAKDSLVFSLEAKQYIDTLLNIPE